jgi:cystathionine beta-lyase/cystathionine gamma-synthase
VAAGALYGATLKMLMNVLEPAGVETRFVDICDLDAVRAAIDEARPGCVLMETVSNPLLRVGQLDRIAAMCRGRRGAARRQHLRHAAAGTPHRTGRESGGSLADEVPLRHGDVLGGIVVADAGHYPVLRTMGRIIGPVLGPFECYLSLRGIKTFPLRMERQCANACRVASWLASHPAVEKVYFTGDPHHPDAETIRRLFPEGMYGAIVSFELKDAGQPDVFRFMDRLQMIVRATSLGDVHTMVLYPAMSSHRDISPKQRERLGIRDNLLRLSVGIEAVEDILADVERALAPS